MKLKANLILAMILLLNVSLFAQNGRNLTGKVLDANNDPLIGVNILIASSSTGTMTDVDGSYSLTVNSGDVVEFSYLGYCSKSVTIADQTELNVVLEEDIEGLNEIVVVGYGAVKKSDVTGSVSSIKSEELNAFPVLDAAQALQGRAAGVVVQSNNGGEPGAPINIKIRGNTSISANSDPLIVVDGFVGATYATSS